jgi:formylglycine-generating enzyme required for sulfatase activity
MARQSRRRAEPGDVVMLPLLQTKLVTKLCVAVLPFVAAIYSMPDRPASSLEDGLAVAVASRDATYRVAGEFTQDGHPVNAPLVNSRFPSGLVVMKTQVSVADYDRCVREGACRAADGRAGRSSDLPVVGVSWEDAGAYARWLSRKSGQKWRLPTDEEWAFFAAERFNDDAIPTGGDFSERWLAKYDAEASRDVAAERTVRPIGTFGVNQVGLTDLAGNVWEWTDTCFTRQKIDADGLAVGTPTENCGVRVVEGRHRAYVTNFIRDARAGGCAVGVPPANLGFRLVRNNDSKRPLVASVTKT